MLLKLLQWGIILMFGLMLWKIFRIMGRSGASRRGMDPDIHHSPPKQETFKDVKDADFVDLKPPDGDKKHDQTQ